MVLGMTKTENVNRFELVKTEGFGGEARYLIWDTVNSTPSSTVWWKRSVAEAELNALNGQTATI